MKDLETYCEYLYHFIYIPIYIYQDRWLMTCFPPQKEDHHPPKKYLDLLWDSEKSISFVTTHQYTYFGRICLNDGSHSIVLGPVGQTPFNNETISDMCKEYIIDASRKEDFITFFHNIPSQNWQAFFNMLLYIHYSLNDSRFPYSEILELNASFLSRDIKENHAIEMYESKENGTLQNSYSIESELSDIIEAGNLEKLKDITKRAVATQVGTIAHDNLRQMKNMFIITSVIVSRAAMKGGLSPSIAYSLSDIYIQQIERLTDAPSITELTIQVQFDYCTRVSDIKENPVSDDLINKTIDYIHNNTNKNLKVEDIAKKIGFSRTHLSRKFTKELGFSISEFIRRCKLEESRNLLAYTKKSISQISSYLCFSSQSHFQKAFKSQYGLTPNEYRKNCASNHSYKNIN